MVHFGTAIIVSNPFALICPRKPMSPEQPQQHNYYRNSYCYREIILHLFIINALQISLQQTTLLGKLKKNARNDATFDQSFQHQIEMKGGRNEGDRFWVVHCVN